MSISQKLQRRGISPTPAKVAGDLETSFAPGITTADGAANIAGDVVPEYMPDRAPIGGGIEDPLSPKPSPIMGPNATY